ncbi:MAG: hypothetical protein KBT46_03130 [Ruminococcus sp.]|nr:hypothetical protein [Candidatus Copronaster equi]
MIKYVPKTADELGIEDKSFFGYVGFDLSENNTECGRSIARLDKYTMEILSVETNADAETVEGFIRSTLNYGANRNAYIAYYKAENGVDVAKTLGFEINSDGILEGEIPFLLQGSCCKDKR